MASLSFHLDNICSQILVDQSNKLPLRIAQPGNIKYLSKASLNKLIQEAGKEKPNDIPGPVSISDLEPSKYEGGFKVWECTIDLLKYIAENAQQFTGKRVLDVGCGAGLVGISCLINKSSHVSFQDFNQEVLKWFTMPNIVLNLENVSIDELSQKVSFFFGDWSEIPVPESNYDVILAAETIYNQENYPKLRSLFDKCLKPDGKVIVAAKTHYFGVGGGTRAFEEFMFSNSSFKKQSVIQVIDAPVQREIISFERQ